VCACAREMRRPPRGLIDSTPVPTDRQLKNSATRRGQAKPVGGAGYRRPTDLVDDASRVRNLFDIRPSPCGRRTTGRHSQHVVVADRLYASLFDPNISSIGAAHTCNPSTTLARAAGRSALPEAGVDDDEIYPAWHFLD